MTTDYLTESGAKLLAENIRAYWLKRGYEVELEIVPVKHRHVTRAGQLAQSTEIIHCIRSDMISGMPRRKTMAKAA